MRGERACFFSLFEEENWKSCLLGGRDEEKLRNVFFFRLYGGGGLLGGATRARVCER